MDAFKQHIKEHLHEIEGDEPQERVWQNIKQKVVLPKAKVISIAIKWAVAACIIGLLGVGLYMFMDKKEDSVTLNSYSKMPHKAEELKNDSVGFKKNNQQPIVNNEVVLVDKKVEPRPNSALKERGLKRKTLSSQNEVALADIEKSFDEVINLQKERVNNTPLNAESPAYFTEFSNEVKSMDGDEATVKKEIKKHGLKPELLDQLINIYQQKLTVLKQLQHEMQKTNNRYKQGRVPTDTTKRYFLNI